MFSFKRAEFVTWSLVQIKSEAFDATHNRTRTCGVAMFISDVWLIGRWCSATLLTQREPESRLRARVIAVLCVRKIEMMPRQTVGVDYGSNCSLMRSQARCHTDCTTDELLPSQLYTKLLSWLKRGSSVINLDAGLELSNYSADPVIKSIVDDRVLDPPKAYSRFHISYLRLSFGRRANGGHSIVKSIMGSLSRRIWEEMDVSQKISCKSRTVDGRQRTSFNSAGVKASNYSADPVNKSIVEARVLDPSKAKIEMMPRHTVGVDYGSNCSIMSRQAIVWYKRPEDPLLTIEFLAADICLGDTDHMWGNCEVCCDINSLSRDLTRKFGILLHRDYRNFNMATSSSFRILLEILDVSQRISCKSRTVDGRQHTSFNSAGLEGSYYSADPVIKSIVEDRVLDPPKAKFEMMPRQTVGVDYGSSCSLMRRQTSDTNHMLGNCEVCCDINSLSRDLTRLSFGRRANGGHSIVKSIIGSFSSRICEEMGLEVSNYSADPVIKSIVEDRVLDPPKAYSRFHISYVFDKQILYIFVMFIAENSRCCQDKLLESIIGKCRGPPIDQSFELEIGLQRKIEMMPTHTAGVDYGSYCSLMSRQASAWHKTLEDPLSKAAKFAAMNSASQEDRATVDCFCEIHAIGPSSK
ncbi:hypothetical protein E3N88_08035 [Mikania micrantha]|uniref:Uncharacterized protein n=1 Tax=Mikania micrantha TaxID=192012 RepID=A0A5N6PF27_9ASTR|nr:hypothetical protein E3N88_08035 [Mikania micrantha]